MKHYKAPLTYFQFHSFSLLKPLGLLIIFPPLVQLVLWLCPQAIRLKDSHAPILLSLEAVVSLLCEGKPTQGLQYMAVRKISSAQFFEGISPSQLSKAGSSEFIAT